MYKGVAAVVVTHEPDLDRLRTALAALSPQVECVLVVDNTPKASAAAGRVKGLAAGLSSTHVVSAGENLGIATALNIGIGIAMEQGQEFVVLSDQDSIPATNMVSSLLAVYRELELQGQNVGAIIPLHIDEVSGRAHGFQVQEPNHLFYSRVLPEQGFPCVEVVTGITSGALCRTSVFPRVGMMREEYFIDSVDAEWFHRARAHGYKVYGTSSAVLQHRLGDTFFRAWLLRWYDVTAYPPLRLYYQYRNFLCMAKEPYVPWRWKVRTALYMIGNAYGHLFFASERLKNLNSICNGVWDAVLGRMGKRAGNP